MIRLTASPKKWCDLQQGWNKNKKKQPTTTKNEIKDATDITKTFQLKPSNFQNKQIIIYWIISMALARELSRILNIFLNPFLKI